MKQRTVKSLQTTSPCYSNAKSTLKVPLTFNRVKKTKHKNFNFVLFLSSPFFFARHNSKCKQCMQISNIPNNCAANLLHSYLFWASCELWVASYSLKTFPKSLCILMRTLLGFSRNNCVGVARTVYIVRPHLDYWAGAVQAVMSLLGTDLVQGEVGLLFSLST